jgi:hypothetical protein
MYQNTNNGEYPPNLAALVENGYLDDTEVLVDPSDDSPRPVGESGLVSSYEYPGYLPRNMEAGSVILYSRKGVYRDGRVVLYVDGMVQFLPEEELLSPGGGRIGSLPEQYDRIVERNSDDLTAEQDAALRAFYEAGP